VVRPSHSATGAAEDPARANRKGRRTMTLRPLLASFLCAGLLGAPLCAALAQEAGKPLPVLPENQAAHDLLPDAIKRTGVIKLATDAHYPTCESFAADGTTMVGFEPDLWNEMAQVLGVKVVPSSIDFDGLIPGIASGRYDDAIECITDRADREAQVTFVDYSHGTGSALYYLKSNPKVKEGDLLSLCGLSTAAQVGNDLTNALEMVSAYCEKRGKPKVKIAEVPQASAVIVGIYAGRYDFTISDAVAFDELRKGSPKPLGTFPFTLRPKTYMGFIVKKDDTALADALLAALKIVVAQGVYDQIWDRWEIPQAKLEDPGINLATKRPLPPAED
jgi:polar amino acid transport system substrate-binding protein